MGYVALQSIQICFEGSVGDSDWTVVLRNTAKTLGLQVVGEATKKFDGGGVTTTLILAESHIAVHTWPEKNFAVVDLLTCKPLSTEEVEHMRNRLEIEGSVSAKTTRVGLVGEES